MLDLKIKGRIIDHLRRIHGGTWIYERRETHPYLQVETGRRVGVFAAWAPRYDGDDDNFVTRLIWQDTGKGAEWQS